MQPSATSRTGARSAIKPWQLLLIAAAMFAFFFARPLYLAHRDGTATFWEKGIFFTGVVLYIGVAGLFFDVLGQTHEVNANGKERVTRRGWTTLLGAAAAGILLLILFGGIVQAMGLHDAAEAPPLPRPTPRLPITDGAH